MISIAILVACAIVGYALRRFEAIRKLEGAITPVVWLLLLTFGLSIGSSESVMADLSRFGTQAAIITAFGTAGSIAAAWMLYKFKKHRRQ
ncbi:MAG: LysO family transporter [Muribaculaceae bacterium]|nr:LysO family transporter [Muribaculaceae bacterium]